MREIFLLSIRQLTGPVRLGLILLLSALPVALAAILAATTGEEGIGHDDFVNVMLSGLLVAGVLPIVVMTLGTAAFGNELEDGTLANLALMPLARWQIVLPKLLATLTISVPVIIASGVATSLIGIGFEVRATLSVGVALLLGVAAYSAIFTWTGLVTSRALAVALLYVILWEGIIGSIIRGVGYLSVRGYTLAIMHGLHSSAFEAVGDRVIALPAAIVGALLVTAAFYGLAVCRLTRMDVP